MEQARYTTALVALEMIAHRVGADQQGGGDILRAPAAPEQDHRLDAISLPRVPGRLAGSPLKPPSELRKTELQAIEPVLPEQPHHECLRDTARGVSRHSRGSEDQIVGEQLGPRWTWDVIQQSRKSLAETVRRGKSPMYPIAHIRSVHDLEPSRLPPTSITGIWRPSSMCQLRQHVAGSSQSSRTEQNALLRSDRR